MRHALTGNSIRTHTQRQAYAHRPPSPVGVGVEASLVHLKLRNKVASVIAPSKILPHLRIFVSQIDYQISDWLDCGDERGAREGRSKIQGQIDPKFKLAPKRFLQLVHSEAQGGGAVALDDFLDRVPVREIWTVEMVAFEVKL